MTSRPKRRTRRVLLSVPVIVWAKLPDSTTAHLRAETVDVNREGAKIRSTQPLQDALRVRIAVLNPYRFADARVVWSNPSRHEYGLELHNPGNFWGIVFPPDDWQEPALVSAPPAAGLPSSLGIPAPAPKPVPVFPKLAPGGTNAIITGFSTVRLPFQEYGVLTPTSAQEAHTLVRPPVDPGTTVRVIIDDQVFSARILAVSSHREKGKWRVALRFSG